MGIRVECDWCREPIRAGRPYVTIEVDGKIGNRDAGGPARVYCGEAEESCAGRLLALLDANPGGPVDMGMEWRLEAKAAPERTESESSTGRGGPRTASSTPRPRPVGPDADVYSFLATLAPGARSRFGRALYQHEITSLDELEGIADAELIEMKGVGWKTISSLRAFLVAWASVGIGTGVSDCLAALDHPSEGVSGVSAGHTPHDAREPAELKALAA